MQFLQLILIDIVLNRLPRLRTQVTSLDVVENKYSGTLVFLWQRSECFMQFLQSLLRWFTSGTICIKPLDKTYKFRVYVFCVYCSRACFCNIGINRIIEIVTFSTSTATFKQFTIALQQDKIGLLVQFHCDMSIGVPVLELVFVLLPYKAL